VGSDVLGLPAREVENWLPEKPELDVVFGFEGYPDILAEVSGNWRVRGMGAK